MKIKSILLHGVLPVAVLVGAVMAMGALMRSRPEAPTIPRDTSAPVVSVEEAVPHGGNLEVRSVGRVRPARELSLMPEVTGRLEWVHPQLSPGGVLQAGEVVARIEGRAFELAVAQQEANVAAARVDLQVEGGRRSVAEREWALLESEVKATAEGRELALRKPYQRLAQVKVASARAALERARLDVDRTQLAVPFNALVREGAIEPGALVGPQTVLARLVGTDAFWVEISLPIKDLDRIRVPRPGSAEAGSPVTVRTTTGARRTGARAPRATYTGRVLRLLGDLDGVGAQARLLVEVSDPLGLQSGQPPLLLNTFVEVSIETESSEESVKVPRVALREGDEVWVLTEEDSLARRRVEIVARERDFVLVSSGVEPGERLITSRLSAPVEGMALRVARPAQAPATLGLKAGAEAAESGRE